MVLVLYAASGFAQAQVFVSSTGSDANPGTSSRPVATVAKAISLTASTGTNEVHMAAGRYDGLVPLRAGVTILGGFKPDFSGRWPELSNDELRSSERDPEKYADHTVLTNGQGDRVVVAEGLSSEATLNNLIVLGPDQSTKQGQSSYAIVAQGGGTLHLKGVKVIGGSGGPGIAGKKGDDANALCTAGGAGGIPRALRKQVSPSTPELDSYCRNHSANDGLCHSYVYQMCESPSGDVGATVADAQGKTWARGGPGGGAGGSSCYFGGIGPARPPFLNQDASEGKPGDPGQPAPTGLGGSATPVRSGSFVLGQDGQPVWVADEKGSDGAQGWSGAGGGGGGAGGSHYTTKIFCDNDVVLGGSGGSGGGGGCGGAGGKGGSGGGGSFALVSGGVQVITERIGIVLGQGGAGGTGGGGGAGRNGDPSRSGSVGRSDGGFCGRSSPMGADGGAGGAGGGGGGGAGGNGGPTVAIARLGPTTPAIKSKGMFSIAGGSRGGQSGEGGTTGAQRSGEPGQVGQVVREQVYFLPVTRLTATASSSNFAPARAVDGDPESEWIPLSSEAFEADSKGAMNPAPTWIEVDLQHVVTVRKLRLRIWQTHNVLVASHVIYLGADPAPTTEFGSFSDATKHRQWIEIVLPDGAARGRYLRVLTSRDTGLVGWYEIQVLH